jgi:hypothetical protein
MNVIAHASTRDDCWHRHEIHGAVLPTQFGPFALVLALVLEGACPCCSASECACNPSRLIEGRCPCCGDTFRAAVDSTGAAVTGEHLGYSFGYFVPRRDL